MQGTVQKYLITYFPEKIVSRHRFYNTGCLINERRKFPYNDTVNITFNTTRKELFIKPDIGAKIWKP